MINQYGEIDSNRAKILFSLGVVDANSLLDSVDDKCPITIETDLDVAMFERALAKIAHSYATAILGLGNFEPCLNKLILEGAEHPGFWIGSLEKNPPPEDTLLELGLMQYVAHNGMEILAVHIRFFSYLGTPNYVIAVGTCDSAILANIVEEKYEKRITITVRDRETNERYHISDYEKFETELDCSTLENVVKASIMMYPQNSHIPIPR